MMAPPYEMIKHSFIPQLKKIGAELDVELKSHGFVPAGGGEVIVKIKPVSKLKPFQLHCRGEFVKQTIHGIVSNISSSVALDEIEVIKKSAPEHEFDFKVHDVDSPGPGNVVLVESEFEHVSEVVSAFGRIGVHRKKVAGDAARQHKKYMKTEAPVGEHLADQLEEVSG